MSKTKIGILGSGHVAQALGSGFLKYGYEVMVGSRDTNKLGNWQNKNKDGKLGSFEATSQFGDIMILAVKGAVAESLIKSVGPNLKGKTVLDTTNPIAPEPPVNGVLKYFTDLGNSLMERLQQLVPEANFVKCFSCVGNTQMVNPSLPGGKPTMFICGNNDASKKEASLILDQFGWEVADMGKVEAARAIEPLCILWCIPGFLDNQWGHAFKLLKP